MSTVATRVGGSKSTLWGYFPSKRALLAAVVDDEVERFGAALDVRLGPDLGVAEALRRFGARMIEIINKPEIVKLHRIVIGEAGRVPELGAIYAKRGPRRGTSRLAAYLRVAMRKGHVRKGDADVAAQQFTALCQAGLHQDRLWGRGTGDDPAGQAADLEAAIACWTAAWTT